MTYEEYTANIYKTRNEIQKLDDAFWENDNPTTHDIIDYKTTRDSLLQKLEAAFQA